MKKFYNLPVGNNLTEEGSKMKEIVAQILSIAKEVAEERGCRQAEERGFKVAVSMDFMRKVNNSLGTLVDGISKKNFDMAREGLDMLHETTSRDLEQAEQMGLSKREVAYFEKGLNKFENAAAA